jgi:hypothetical protein
MTVVNIVGGFGSPMLSKVVLYTLADFEIASQGLLQKANVHPSKAVCSPSSRGEWFGLTRIQT